MLYLHRFRVEAPLAEVAAFHRRSASLKAITPPGIPMRFLEPPPAELAPGDSMTFVLWAGPVPVRWTARIEELADGEGFIDRQVAGPFEAWEHRHRFEADGAGATWVDDRVEARLSRNPLRAALGLGMWLGLPVLFAYRGYRTRKLLG